MSILQPACRRTVTVRSHCPFPYRIASQLARLLACFYLPALLPAMAICLFLHANAGAQPPLSQLEPVAAVDARRLPAEFTSDNFQLCTDLSEDKAQALLKRLEAVLATICKYWGRPAANVIECYVVDKMENWRDDDFPHAFARTLILGVGGGAYAEEVSGSTGKIAKVTVYASSRPGTAEHEIVHAYCGQSFGSSGPDWYKEGMAELAYHGGRTDQAIAREDEVIKYLQTGPRRSMQEIIALTLFNQNLGRSLERILATAHAETSEQRDAALTAWLEKHDGLVRAAREDYHWCWTLCHFLHNNANYSARFRLLGTHYLNDRSHAFESIFGPMQQELDFEYRFFTERIGVGYRVDLCRWDWKHRFRKLTGKQAASSRIKAAGGFQPTGAIVCRNRQYAYHAAGCWQTSQDTPEIDADGGPQKCGRLVGVIMTDYVLGEPFELGKRGTFKAAADGRLYVRCQDDWNQLADNTGIIKLQVQPVIP